MPSNFLFKFIFECSHRAIPNISDRFSIRFSVGGTKKQKMCGFILDEYGELSNGYLCAVCVSSGFERQSIHVNDISQSASQAAQTPKNVEQRKNKLSEMLINK